MDCTCCLQRPVTNPEHTDRSNGPSNGQLLCEDCYYGMDQSLDEHGNLLPEALFYSGDDEELVFLATFIGNGRCDWCGAERDDLMLYHSNDQILCDDCAGY